MPQLKRLDDEQVEDLFIAIWKKLAYETYDSLFIDDILIPDIIADCAELYPKLYIKILNLMEEEASDKGWILP